MTCEPGTAAAIMAGNEQACALGADCVRFGQTRQDVAGATDGVFQPCVCLLCDLSAKATRCNVDEYLLQDDRQADPSLVNDRSN